MPEGVPEPLLQAMVADQREAEKEEEKRLRREESEALAAVHARLNVSRRGTLSHSQHVCQPCAPAQLVRDGAP